MSKETSGVSKSDAREREHARRNARQEELLLPAYRRLMHRAHVEAQLRLRTKDGPTAAASGRPHEQPTDSLAASQRKRR